MFPKYAFFNVAAALVLFWLSVVGAIAALPGWIATEPEYDDGVQSPGGRCLARARIFMTAGCGAVWICTFLGLALSGSKELAGLTFGFWQDHPVVLQGLFFPIDAAFAASVFFATQARGRRAWIVQVATPIMAIASILGSVFLWST
jgi:hypothetical protein